MSNLSRRQLLLFLGAAGGATAFAPAFAQSAASREFAAAASLGFTPVRLAHDLPIYTTLLSFLPNGTFAPGGQQGSFVGTSSDPKLDTYTYYDDVIVPPEYERYVITGWGDRVFPTRPGTSLDQDYVGYNADFTAFFPINGNKADGYLWINHEYNSFPIDPTAPEAPADLLSSQPSYPLVIGRTLPSTEKFGEFMYGMGGSIIRITKDAGGRYKVNPTDSKNRRIHALSGLALNAGRTDSYKTVLSWGALAYQQGDLNFLEGTGPASTDVFPLSSDGLGNLIIGTGYNCSGGATPWGTVLSAEENFQASSLFYVGVTESVAPNGTQTGYTTGTTGAAFGLVGEKYGYMVEISPADPSFRARKHTALGRFRHENAAFRASSGQPLVVYMGDDRRGGHTWKYVSSRNVNNPTNPANSALLEDGTLYVAKFNPDGTGVWLPLVLNALVDPVSPLAISSDERAKRVDGLASRNANTLFPKRNGVAGQTSSGGAFALTTLNELTLVNDVTNIDSYRTFGSTKTLGTVTLADYYTSQGAVLVDAFLAANLIGGTPTGRPEDIEVNPRNRREVFIAYTDGNAGSDGYADSQIFVASKYTTAVDDTQPSGGLYKIIEGSSNGAGLTFTWQRFLQCGESGAEDGAGFANVDNLIFDNKANLWGVTDMSTGLHNGIGLGLAAATLTVDHTALGGSNLVGVFGNNWLFYTPTSGPNAGAIVPFAYGPTRCELTGPTFTDDTLIISVQHPGEDCPINDGTPAAALSRSIEMLDLFGGLYTQTRNVPRGSNWPSNIPVADGGLASPLGAPRPSVIGIRRRPS